MNHRVARHCATKPDYGIHAATKLISHDSAFSLASILLTSDTSVKALSRLSIFFTVDFFQPFKVCFPVNDHKHLRRKKFMTTAFTSKYFKTFIKYLRQCAHSHWSIGVFR